MNTSLTTFMSMAITVIILFSLVGGIVYSSLHDKYENHKEVVEVHIDY